MKKINNKRRKLRKGREGEAPTKQIDIMESARHC